MKIGSLKINGINNPLGYAYEGVTLSWIVEEAAASKQKETVVKVASDKGMKNVIFEKRGVLPCSGVELEVKPTLRTAYYVTVEVTAEDGSCAVSEVASFETGKMDEPWEAKWIGTGADYKAHPVLFKEFTACSQKPVSKARLYITGVGLYEAFINGKKVGEDLLAPFFNDYN
ncbi:MAG: alpha-L-rhamnosidase N-terminal domain-containing protein, partial [Bacteroidaceae bacterium]|nr:alpha-L-rhamnosidase N-terminal domain-containing protein [Bacteroidaceae bacterium]